MSPTGGGSTVLCDEPEPIRATVESRGMAAVRRLTEELDSIDSALLKAERTATAIGTRPRRHVSFVPDLDTRLHELEQREAELVERERRLEGLRASLLELQDRVARARDALARTLRRLRAEHETRCGELAVRESRVAAHAAELAEARRAILRLECTHKALARAGTVSTTAQCVAS